MWPCKNKHTFCNWLTIDYFRSLEVFWPSGRTGTTGAWLGDQPRIDVFILCLVERSVSRGLLVKTRLFLCKTNLVWTRALGDLLCFVWATWNLCTGFSCKSMDPLWRPLSTRLAWMYPAWGQVWTRLGYVIAWLLYNCKVICSLILNATRHKTQTIKKEQRWCWRMFTTKWNEIIWSWWLLICCDQ